MLLKLRIEGPIQLNFKIVKNESGNIGLLVGLLLVVLIGGGGMAVDIALLNQQKAKLQAAADASALASAREMGLASINEDNLNAIAVEYAQSNFFKLNEVAENNKENMKIDVEIDPDQTWVTVDLAFSWAPFFAHLISDEANPIRVSATASLAGSEPVCVVALDPDNAQSLFINGASSITSNGCSIYANSSSNSGIELVESTSLLSASSIFISGGFSGNESNFTPSPVTDSPPIDDPLIQRSYPDIEACEADKTALRFTLNSARRDSRYSNGVLVLEQGTYCDGLQVLGNVSIEFEAGVYVFKDGPLLINGNATVSGENVGFFFTGDNSTFEFTGSSQINLTAPEDGPLAGILFFQDRDAALKGEFRIETRDAERFEGVVYLPRGRFIVDKNTRLGQQSDWTAIIAYQIETGEGPELIINSDYAASSIPVPDGIAPSGGGPILTGRQN